MKFSDLPPPESGRSAIAPRLLRDFEAAQYLRSPVLLDLLEKAGWVKPCVRRHKLKLYDRRRLDEACDRLEVESLPGDSSISESEGAKWA